MFSFLFLGGGKRDQLFGAWNQKKSLREVCRERSCPLHVGQFCALQLNPDTDRTAKFRRYLAVFHSCSVTQSLFLFLTMCVIFFLNKLVCKNDLNVVFVGENSLLIRLQKQLFHYIVNRIGVLDLYGVNTRARCGASV